MIQPGHFWRKIQRAQADYDRLDPHPGVVPEYFHQWTQEQYGIQFVATGRGDLTYNIVDEQKYLIFELKYSN